MKTFISMALIAALSSVPLSGTAVAQEDAAAEGLIKDYAAAIAGEDEAAIDRAWEALNASAATKEHLRRAEPRLFQSFEYWRIKRELKQLREERGLTRPEHSERLLPAAGGTVKSNKERVMAAPNQERSSNRTRALASPNQDRRPNQERVQNLPNEDRPSNQERIRSRLRSLR